MSRKLTKGKKLYKVFRYEPEGPYKGRLEGPYSGSYYIRRDPKTGYDSFVRIQDAPGWVSDVEKGIRACHRGWHAYDFESLVKQTKWPAEKWSNGRFTVCFEVELRNCYEDKGYWGGPSKWVGQQVKILRRFPRSEYREKLRALKAKRASR